jgi:hypothetical protein
LARRFEDLRIHTTEINYGLFGEALATLPRPLVGRDTQVANHLDGLMSKQPALALAN